jgi:hypothetical protein
MNSTTVQSHLLPTEKVSHPRIAQFNICQHKSLIVNPSVSFQGRDGQEQTANVRAKIVVPIGFNQAGSQSPAKSRLIFNGPAPSDAIEYPKILSAQGNAVQPRRRTVSSKTIEYALSEEERPYCLVRK